MSYSAWAQYDCLQPGSLLASAIPYELELCIRMILTHCKQSCGIRGDQLFSDISCMTWNDEGLQFPILSC